MHFDWNDMDDLDDVVEITVDVINHLGPKDPDKPVAINKSKTELIPAFFVVVAAILILTAVITFLFAVVNN